MTSGLTTKLSTTDPEQLKVVTPPQGPSLLGTSVVTTGGGAAGGGEGQYVRLWHQLVS